MGSGCTRNSAVEPWQPVVPTGNGVDAARASQQASASRRPCNSIRVARLRQQRNSAEDANTLVEVTEFPINGSKAMTVSALQSLISQRWSIPPSMQLLSCIDDQFHQGQEEVPPENRLPRVHLLEPEVRDSTGIRQADRQIGEFGFPSEKLWVHLTDFRKLRPAQAREPFCRMPDPKRRGITVAQLMRVVRFIQEYTGPGDVLLFWCDRQLGKALHSKDMNFYTLCDWVIWPSTYSSRCSFAEFLAMNPAEQLPRWYASHWYGMPLMVFVQCLKDHCRVRCLPDTCSYWLSAACVGQYKLGEELPADFRESSSFKVIQECDGMLFVVDTQLAVFRRRWCCFEAFMALQPDHKRIEPPLFDIAAACKNPQASLRLPNTTTAEISTDGLTDAELQQEEAGSSGWSAKAKREANFPLNVISQGMAVEVQASQASNCKDHFRILNLIAQRPSPDLDEEPFDHHDSYDGFNAQLRSAFALAGWRQCVDQNIPDFDQLSTLRLSRTVREDAKRLNLQLGFVHCGASFDNVKLKEVANAMSPSLKAIQLLISGCAVDTNGIAAFLRKVPCTLDGLVLGLGRIRLTDSDMETLTALLPPELQQLELGLAGTNLTELKTMNFPAGLAALDINVSNIPALGKTALRSMAVPKQLQLLHLQLRRTGFCSEDLVQLCKLMPEGMQVLDLNLDGTGIANFSGLSLPPYLVDLEVSLGGNRQFGDFGFITLVKALPQTLSRLSLNFRLTGVGDEGMAELAECMPQNLEDLLITAGGSAVTTAGLRSLAIAMDSTKHLSNLTVDCSAGQPRRKAPSAGSACHSRVPDAAEPKGAIYLTDGEDEATETNVAAFNVQAHGHDEIFTWRQALLNPGVG
eukprot:TRINITY_DN893_c0_g2_i1.p1 TRINITY_DN893_c0_g2~~TRINITY_DN893_c0_g2_i1.p1  ORF type:complete len:860 (+),score=149.62 TRINITY_DN893_c0_g2_i1:112-2691(+)